ncbi:helix-turn-helix domain-containing protein [Xylophilus sp. Kf1]|nr:helix-turn-helix domain-containing protein [Xylophilus sp. Kf1]
MLPLSETPKSDHQTGTQVLHRASRLLRAVAAKNRVGSRLTDLCHVVGIERPTGHRILQALVGEGLLRQNEVSKRYYLGTQLYEMGLVATPRFDIRDLCHPFLQGVAAITGDSTFLTARAGFDGVCLDRVEGNFPIRVFIIEVGLRRPLNVGGGAITILSCLPDEEIERILRANADRCRERFPRYSEASVRRLIDATRHQGFLTNDVIELPSVRTFAMPIRHPDGSPVAAISTSTISPRLDGERLETVRTAIAEAVRGIEAQLAAHAEAEAGQPDDLR